MTESKTLPTKS